MHHANSATISLTKVVLVEPLDSKDLAHLTLLDRKELGITFTKVLQC